VSRIVAPLAFLIAAAMFAAAAPAESELVRGPYKTPAQAERFLEIGPSRTALWSSTGVDLGALRRAAFCVNGRHSQIERRTGIRFPQGRRNRSGDPVFRSFACTLMASRWTFRLYLFTCRRSVRCNGWSVLPDRVPPVPWVPISPMSPTISKVLR
jgi:hypothetical protein